jgi:hypothetical protein
MAGRCVRLTLRGWLLAGRGLVRRRITAMSEGTETATAMVLLVWGIPVILAALGNVWWWIYRSPKKQRDRRDMSVSEEIREAEIILAVAFWPITLFFIVTAGPIFGVGYCIWRALNHQRNVRIKREDADA